MKMNSLKGLLFLLILFSGSVVFGQTITGTVTGDNFPLPGVNIAVEGTQKGAVTDFDGLYSIDGVKAGDVLVFSSIGFTTKKVTAIGNAVIDVDLEEDITALEDVVVVGYTKTTRGKLTTAVSSVGSEQISEIPAASVNEALEGRASGVQVSSAGSPGEESNVVIRGNSTFGDGRPLYVVDGVFVESISQISPESIASVDVLKDAAASAVYGSRASNGVIVVTTKRGSAGKPKFSFSTYSGIQFLDKSKLPDLISGPDLVNLLKTEDIDNTVPGNQSPSRFDDPDFVAGNFNHIEDVYRVANQRNFNIGVTGGSEKANFSLNAGYFDQEGILINTRFRRYTLAANSDFKITDNFKIGQTLNTGYSKTALPRRGGSSTDAAGFRDLQNLALEFPSYLPLRNSDGVFQLPTRAADGVGFTGGNVFNPLFENANRSNDQYTFTLNASVYADIKLNSWLSNKTTIAATYFNQEQNRFKGAVITEGDNANLIGGNPEQKIIEFEIANTVTTTFTNQLSFSKSFDKHYLGADAIFERIDNRARRVFTQNTSTVPNIARQITDRNASQSSSLDFPDVLTSYVGLLNYSFDDKYIFSGSLRRDASSKFARPVGIFPAASVAWVVSNEGFFDSVPSISNFKLRYGYGETGNNRIRPFLATRRLGFPDPGDGPLAVDFIGVDQSELTWETSVKQNIGVDLGFLADKIKFTAEYYTNDSENLLAFGLSNPSGGANNGVGNVGETSVRGYDFSLSYDGKIKDFTYGIWGQLSTVETTVENIELVGSNAQRLNGANFSPYEGEQGIGVSRLQIGDPIWAIYGDRTNGLYTSEDQIIDESFVYSDGGPVFLDQSGANVIKTISDNGVITFTNDNGDIVDRSNVSLSDEQEVGTDVGDIRFVDSNNDGVLDDSDQVVIGNPNPDFTYSFNLTAAYKGFDLSAFFKGVEGVDALNGNSVITFQNGGNVTFGANVLDRYTVANTDTNIPRYTIADVNRNRRFSDRFIEDASYLRLKSLIIGYSFNDNALQSIIGGALTKLRFYVQGQNLFTITDYSGLDPEIRPSYAGGPFFGDSFTVAGLGIDRGGQPAAISFNFGVQVGF